MLSRIVLGLLSISLLFGCAQIGYITGGDEDITAPIPNKSEMIPANESTNFTGNEMKIPFDDFIKLNNPVQNIQMVPPHATISARVKGKDLYLSWEEKLQANTTYSIFLNNAVQDITEKNDSTMQFVFSTGNVIDSLSYQGFVVDAYTNTTVKGVYLALFNRADTSIVSLAETNSAGIATMNYLKPGNYELIAFKDLNLNLKYDTIEPVAFPSYNFDYFDKSINDTIPLRYYTPLAPARITTATFVGPASIQLASNRSFENEDISIDGMSINETQVLRYAPDSILISLEDSIPEVMEVILSNNKIVDTNAVRVKATERLRSIDLISNNKERKVLPGDQLHFLSNDLITAIDTAKISIIGLNDSTQYFLPISFKGTQIELDPSTVRSETIKLTFDSLAIATNHGNSIPYECTLTLLSPEDVGLINLSVENVSQPVIIEVISKGKTVRTFHLNESKKQIIHNLLPAEYTFKVIEDTNNNGSWDAGNYALQTQPERVLYFSKPIKVRANWDVDVTLDVR